MGSFEEYAKTLNISGLITASIISALSFVVGLFWRDAIKKTIEEFVPKASGLFWSYVVAIIVTLIVVIIAFILIKLQEAKIHEIIINQLKEKAGKSSKRKKSK